MMPLGVCNALSANIHYFRKRAVLLAILGLSSSWRLHNLSSCSLATSSYECGPNGLHQLFPALDSFPEFLRRFNVTRASRRQMVRDSLRTEKSPAAAPQFRVLQYNILAKSLGNNEEPWFLYGSNVSHGQRKLVVKKHSSRNKDGSLRFKGFKHYAEDLTEKQKKEITEHGLKFFDWASESRRGERLSQHIANQSADIIVLEEVDVFLDDADDGTPGIFSLIDASACEALQYSTQKLRVQLQTRSESRASGVVYDGYFAKREARNDGVAILWKRARFEMSAWKRIIFQGTGPPDRVLGMVFLSDLQWKRTLLVIGTHLERNPEDPSKEEVRYLQMLQLLDVTKASIGSYDAVVLAGDMNADVLEERWTAAYQIMRDDMKPHFAEAFEPMLARHKAEQKFCATKRRMHEQPPDLERKNLVECHKFCTSRTHVRRVWIDYVFYSPHSLHVKRMSGPELCPDDPIPDSLYPSDHVPMLVDFSWGGHAQIPPQTPAHEVKDSEILGFWENPMDQQQEELRKNITAKFRKTLSEINTV